MKKHIMTEYTALTPSAYVTNGFIGFRFPAIATERRCFEDNLWGWNVISGYTERDWDGFGVSGIAPVPTPCIDIELNGEKAKAEFVRQTYDFSNGELMTELNMKTSAHTVKLTHRIFCSRYMPTLLVYETMLEADADLNCNFQVRLTIDQKQMNPDNIKFREEHNDYDVRFCMNTRRHESRLGVAVKTEADAREIPLHQSRDRQTENEITYSHLYALEKEQPARVITISAFVPDALHSEPEMQAVREMKLAKWEGYDALLRRNREIWADIWKGRIVIDGVSEDFQDMIDASFFYMMASCHRGAAAGLGPFGLSHEYYNGHVFWDCDSFMFMVPLLLAPDVAENMLEYRFDRLPAARNNARLNGYKGVLYPWQSGRTGCEVTTPTAAGAGGAGEQHVNMDVALGFDAYARVSGDDVFLREKAWPVMRGVAEWITSRVTKTARGYEILHVTGIDEGTDNVANDAFTNIMCQKILRTANEYAQKLGYRRREDYDKIADGLVIPVSPALRYMEQFEGVHVKDKMPSETLMAFFPYGYRHSDEIDKNTYRFYLEHGMEIGMTYPMLSGFLGIFPAWLGERDIAKDYYEAKLLDFFVQPYWQCTESGDATWKTAKGEPVATCFMTGRGSLLSGLLMGLTRMNIFKSDEPAEWFEGPISLPAGWNSVTLSRVYIHGKSAKIVARHGDARAELSWLED